MKIQLVSNKSNKKSLNKKQKIEVFIDVVNNSKADLILFPGWTLAEDTDIHQLEKKVANKSVSAFFELSIPTRSKSDSLSSNRLFFLSDGKIEDLGSHQHFSTSKGATLKKINSFVDDFEEKRKKVVCGKVVRVVICGEMNVLKTIKDKNYEASIRYPGSDEAVRFERLLAETDIILNYLHSPQYSRQHIHGRRREFFSNDKKVFVSTNNYDEGVSFSKTVQYHYHDGVECTLGKPEKGKHDCMIRIVEI